MIDTARSSSAVRPSERLIEDKPVAPPGGCRLQEINIVRTLEVLLEYMGGEEAAGIQPLTESGLDYGQGCTSMYL